MVKLIEADPLKQINHFNRWSTLPIDRNFTGIDSFNQEEIHQMKTKIISSWLLALALCTPLGVLGGWRE
jgi:hypothetical protein